MRRVLLVALAFAGLGAGGPALASGQAAATRPAEAGPGLIEAGTIVEGWLDDADREAKPAPRLADPAMAPTLRAAFNQDALKAVDPVNIPQLIGVCGVGANILLKYATLGIPKEALATELNAVQQAKAGENTRRYQDEVALAMPYTIECSAMQISAIRDQFGAREPEGINDQQRAGLEMMRRGVADTITGVLHLQSDPIRAANKKVILDKAVKRAGVLAAVLDVPARQALADQIDKLLESGVDPAALRALRAAILTAPCGGLCKA